VPDDESVLYVPLRSNAKALVTGAPVAALRRRLKYASVFQDQLLLESGVLRMEAGEGGSSIFAVPVMADRPARWQTPRQRQLAQQSSFQISMGREITPGVPAEVMHPVLSSDSAISWTATLQPFAAELPAGTDWIHFGKFTGPGQRTERVAQDWTWADERNPYLEQVVPGRFVRSAVIKNANADLALAAAAGCTVTMDGLHSQVVAQRFGKEAGWKLRGYAIAFLFPQIGDWTWQQIGDLGRATATIAAGYVISSGSGLMTFGLKGLSADLASAAAGAAPGAFLGVRQVCRQRRSRGWVTVRNKIIGLDA
jgi:hypothetical protein